MSYRIGDPIFSKLGQPGVIVNTGADKRTIVNDKPLVKEYFRHGYIAGLPNRTEFNKILDEVKALEDPNQKIAKLAEHVNELESTPTHDSQLLARYLKAEMSHLMNIYNIKPRIYETSYHTEGF